MNGSCLACITFALCIPVISVLATPELKLVHVLFSHKLRAPKEDPAKETSLPRVLSYEYLNAATLNMSKNASIHLYDLGAHLRATYGDFLDDSFRSDITRMRTTEYVLSMLSGQLVNAGLWPPSKTQTWMKDFNWQPVPTEYVELKKDTLMLGSLCPNFISQMDRVLETTETREMISKYRILFDYLSHHTQRRIETPSDVALLYAILETMADQGETLPHWARDVFPDGMMYNVTLLEYDLLSATPLQRKLNGGTFLGEIIGNSLRYTIGDIPKESKMMLYSGDERNIVGVLKNLNLWSPHIPNQAASLIFELYFDTDTNMYGTKINYYTGTDDTTISLSLSDCTEICPLHIFLGVALDSISEDPQSLCEWSAESAVDVKLLNNNGSDSYKGKNLIFNLILLCLMAWILK